MDYLIQNAWAQGAGGAGELGLASFLPLIILFVVFYLFLIRPQMKRQKEHRKMISEIKAGDEVVVAGGLAGRGVRVSEQFLAVEIANGVEVKVQKQAVGQLLPKGTLSTL